MLLHAGEAFGGAPKLRAGQQLNGGAWRQRGPSRKGGRG